MLSHLLPVYTQAFHLQHPSSIHIFSVQVIRRKEKNKLSFLRPKTAAQTGSKLIISCLIHQMHNKNTKCSHADYKVYTANQ